MQAGDNTGGQMDTTTEATEIGLGEAAHRLGVSWEVAWRLLLKGKLVGEKRGRTWIVDAGSVEAYRAARTGAA